METPELTGLTVTLDGLFTLGASVRAPVIVGVFGAIGVEGVALGLPPLLKELPAPVVPPARLS